MPAKCIFVEDMKLTELAELTFSTIENGDENFKDLLDAKELRKIYDARTSIKLEKEEGLFKKAINKIKGKKDSK